MKTQVMALSKGKVAKTLKTILKSIIGIFIGIIIAYGVFMGVYHYTSTPEFCAKCHYVQPYVASWEKTPHKDVSCMQCHEPSGPLGKLHSKIRGLNYYLMDKTGNYSSFLIKAAYINESNCFVCHIDQNKDHPAAVKLDRVKFDHLKSTKNDESCLSCHRDVGHSTDIGIEKVIK